MMNVLPVDPPSPGLLASNPLLESISEALNAGPQAAESLLFLSGAIALALLVFLAARFFGRVPSDEMESPAGGGRARAERERPPRPAQDRQTSPPEATSGRAIVAGESRPGRRRDLRDRKRRRVASANRAALRSALRYPAARSRAAPGGSGLTPVASPALKSPTTGNPAGPSRVSCAVKLSEPRPVRAAGARPFAAAGTGARPTRLRPCRNCREAS